MRVTEKMAARCRDLRSCRPAVIACLGDSVTHGCFELIDLPDGRFDTTYRPHEGYEAQLQRRLNTLFPAAAPCVMDAGISGDSAAGGLERLERDVLSLNPDLVVVNFGLNDACQSALTEEDFAASMREIFRRVLASGAECMLLTPNYMCTYVQPFIVREDLREMAATCVRLQTEGRLTRFVEAARAAARELRMPIADAYARWQAYERAGVDTTSLLANGINHPCREMHALFVETILEKLFE